jgi:glycogen synthase
VVASDAGGLREVVVHDETGTLSFAGNPESLAWAILQVLRNPEQARQMTVEAKKRLTEEFHWSTIAEQTRAVYERIWSEFLQSYWAEDTVWPVTPGAEDRAERLQLRDKATSGAYPDRPRPRVLIQAPPIAQTLAEEGHEDGGVPDRKE